ncbi:MAG: Ni/Fe hydrogenase subunit gamma [Nitrospinae bacterium RIFCSPLOWO2_12_39_15]|nr:MAG: Ni/Fe hydrogenase subunit gamma [Nitrospinae bacterium RIFCSPLOWO2_12_39_15]
MVHNIDPMIPIPAHIRRVNWETEDTFTLLLEPECGNNNKFQFLPGQFNMLYAFGIGESAISISSDPFKKNTISHTIHRLGIVTNSLSQLKHGDTIGLRGPFGNGWPVENAKGMDVCIVAGGIGLAPLRPVIYSILRSRKKYRKIFLLYGARSPLDLLYRAELEQWGKFPDIHVLITADHGDSSWKGNVGVVTKLFSYIKLDGFRTTAMICGPEIMMKFTLQELQQYGVPPNQIFISMERNMKCGIGLCGHCQCGPKFVCKDGPVFPLPQVSHLLDKKEI